MDGFPLVSYVRWSHAENSGQRRGEVKRAEERESEREREREREIPVWSDKI
jgi:hypothetical protein